MIQPSQLLSLAKDLSTTKDEAYYRTVISRAYYCAYHTALPYSEISPVERNTRAGAHANVILRLSNWPVRAKHRETIMELRRLGAVLGSLKGKRIDADYVLDCNIGHEDVALMLKDVETFLECFSKFPEVDELQVQLIT